MDPYLHDLEHARAPKRRQPTTDGATGDLFAPPPPPPAPVPDDYTQRLRRDYRESLAEVLNRVADAHGVPRPTPRSCTWCDAPPCDRLTCADLRHQEGQR
jgi:hypothetical protein